MRNIYDFDGTLYGGDSTFDFILYCFRHHPGLLRFLPSQGWAFLLYRTGRIPKTAFKQRLYRMFSGCHAEAMLEAFWDSHQHKIFSWYPHQQEEGDIVISASPEFLLQPICRRLGIRYLIASRVDSATGVYTGENCWGPEKVIRLKDTLGIDHCRNFYSDSYSDQPLADIADQAFLIKRGKICPWTK